MSEQARPDPLAGHPRYRKIKDLNSGTFGFVVLTEDMETGEHVAIKFIERGEKVTRYVIREVLNHRALLHPHIIQFKQVFLTARHLCIVMEYAPGGDMFDYVVKRGGLKETEARWFFQQLIVALDYCHRQGVVSRDIKLENTLLDNSPRPLLKLCDFGYSKNENVHSQPKSKVGTPGYIAPEVIERREYDGKTADVWSCGVMLYVMLVGAYPFERPEDKNNPKKLQKMIERILAVDYRVPSRVHMTPQCRDLMERILVKDPATRITIKEIYQHAWYQMDLPPGVSTMNDHWRPPIEQAQREDAVVACLETAREAPPLNEDAMIDAAMESGMDDLGASGSISGPM